MNLLQHCYPGAPTVLLVANIFLQIAGAVLAALLAAWITARRNAALRHGIWLGALAWVCLSPLAAWTLGHRGITLWPRLASPPVLAQAASPGVSPKIIALPQFPEPTRPIAIAVRPQQRIIQPILGGIFVLWLGGTVLLLARLAYGLGLVMRLRRSSSSADDLVRSIRPRLLQSLGVDALPPILLSPCVGGPVTIGIWRPVVILPTALAAQMTQEELHDALAHECSHALRRDYAIGIAQRLAAAVFWIHPLIHLLNRQLSRACEERCDNAVIRAAGATAYARTLLSLAQKIPATWRQANVVGLLDRQWPLENRIAGLLNPRRNLMTRMNKSNSVLLATLVLVLGTALATAGPSAQSTPAAPELPANSDQKPAAGTSAPQAATPTPEKRMSEAEFNVRRAELDLEEAQVQLEAKRNQMDLYNAARNSGAVSAEDANKAELELNLARIRVAKAKLQCDEAMAKKAAENEVDASVGEVYIAGAVERAGVYSITHREIPVSRGLIMAGVKLNEANERNVRVTLKRREHGADTTVLDKVLVRDLIDGKTSDPVLKPSDMLIVE